MSAIGCVTYGPVRVEIRVQRADGAIKFGNYNAYQGYKIIKLYNKYAVFSKLSR